MLHSINHWLVIDYLAYNFMATNKYLSHEVLFLPAYRANFNGLWR